MRSSSGIGVAAALVACVAEAPAMAVPADFAAKAEAYLKSAYPADAPGAAVIVVEDGRTVYAGGQGLADVAAGRRITPETVFRLGSITKQFTAAVILQLAEEGKLSLADPLSKFLPDYPAPGADATVVQLLNHTSGIKSYTGIPGWMREENTARAFTSDQLIAEFKDQPADFEAGTQHRYNNSGYVLLGAIIEKVTGKPWHAAIEERIARPLGLETIRYGQVESSMPEMAVGYTVDGGVAAPAQKVHMSVPHAAGGLIGSVQDLARWAEALHEGEVVKAPSYAQMIAPTKLTNGETVPYGYGISNQEIRGRPSIGHGGGIFGFSTASDYLPEEDLFVAVFANSDEPAVDPRVVLNRIAAMALGDPYPEFQKVALSPADVEPLLGVYRLEDGERTLFLKDGRLFTRRSGGSDSEVFAAGKNRFFYGPDSLTWFEIERDPQGKHVMNMHQGGSSEVERAVRVGPVPVEPTVVTVPRPVLERYVGDYRAQVGLARVAMGEDGDLTIQLGGQRPVRLLGTSSTEFRPEGVDAKIVFHGDSDAVTHLVVHQGGREIRADRE